MRVLIVEDDEELCEILKFNLELEGYTVDICYDGADGLHWAAQQAHDLILLDRMLPELDGVRLLQKLRGQGVRAPVLMVTALGAVGDRVEGLDAGADDYLAKPFAMEELLARVRAMCRRPQAIESGGSIQKYGVTYNPGKKSLTGERGECHLSRREADMLEVFLRNPGNTITRQILLSRVWGPDAGVVESSLDSYVYFLRAHLRDVGCHAAIVTVRGVGYRLEAPDV